MLDYNFSKIFTLEEANNSLPLVGRIVTDILSVGAEIRNSLRDSGEKPTIVENYDPRTFTKEQNQINHLMNELTEIGCFYKDWNFTLGLIDFPANALLPVLLRFVKGWRILFVYQGHSFHS